MKTRAYKVVFRGRVENRDAAFALLAEAGDVALVVRGRPRLIVLRCPCGCGDDLLINLDPRTGPAWEIYGEKKMTLYPSYWRDTACGSHFIIWNSRIYWCSGWETEESQDWVVPKEVENLVFAALPEDHFESYRTIAHRLDIIPWEVLQACRQLQKKDLIVKRPDKGEYRRRGYQKSTR